MCLKVRGAIGRKNFRLVNHTGVFHTQFCVKLHSELHSTDLRLTSLAAFLPATSNLCFSTQRGMASSGGLDNKSKLYVNSAGSSPVYESDLNHDSTTALNEVVINLTGEDDEKSSDHASLPSKTGELMNEAIEAKIVTPRTYQLEMLAESMKGNAIVTVSSTFGARVLKLE
jgi:hypothetical protein